MIDVSVTTAICGTGTLWYEKGRFAHVAFELLTCENTSPGLSAAK